MSTFSREVTAQDTNSVFCPPKIWICPSASPYSPGASRSPNLEQDLSQSNPGLSITNEPRTLCLCIVLPHAFPGLSDHTCPLKKHPPPEEISVPVAWAELLLQGVFSQWEQSLAHRTLTLEVGDQQQGAGRTGLLCWGGQSRMHRSPCHSTSTVGTGHSGTLPSKASGNNTSQHQPSEHQTRKGKATPKANHEIWEWGESWRQEERLMRVIN